MTQKSKPTIQEFSLQITLPSDLLFIYQKLLQRGEIIFPEDPELLVQTIQDLVSPPNMSKQEFLNFLKKLEENFKAKLPDVQEPPMIIGVSDSTNNEIFSQKLLASPKSQKSSNQSQKSSNSTPQEAQNLKIKSKSSKTSAKTIQKTSKIKTSNKNLEKSTPDIQANTIKTVETNKNILTTEEKTLQEESQLKSQIKEVQKISNFSKKGQNLKSKKESQKEAKKELKKEVKSQKTLVLFYNNDKYVIPYEDLLFLPNDIVVLITSLTTNSILSKLEVFSQVKLLWSQIPKDYLYSGISFNFGTYTFVIFYGI